VALGIVKGADKDLAAVFGLVNNFDLSLTSDVGVDVDEDVIGL
jgi:hypothetical protein